MYVWSSRALPPSSSPIIRVQGTGGRSSSTVWSGLLERWTDDESKKHCVLDYDDPGCVRHWERRRGAVGAFAAECRWLCARPALPAVLCDDPGILESGGSDCHSGARVFAGGGIGCCLE